MGVALARPVLSVAFYGYCGDVFARVLRLSILLNVDHRLIITLLVNVLFDGVDLEALLRQLLHILAQRAVPPIRLHWRLDQV